MEKKNGLGSQDSRHKAVNQAINWTVKCCVFSTHQYSLRKGLSQDKLLSVIPWENGKYVQGAGATRIDTMYKEATPHSLFLLLCIAAHVELTLPSGRYTSTPILSATCDTNRHPGISKCKNPKMMLI